MISLLVAFRVNVEQRVQHTLLIHFLKNSHIVVLEGVCDSLPAIWKEANTTESLDTLIGPNISKWLWMWMMLASKMFVLSCGYIPYTSDCKFKSTATCFETYMLCFQRCCLFGHRNVCYRVTFVVTDTYTWWQWLLKTLSLLKNRAYLCFIWQCGLDCC